MHLQAQKNLSQRISDLYDGDFLKGLKPIYYRDIENKLYIEGYISNFDFYKSNHSYIKIFVNKRVIYYRKIIGMLKKIYGELLPSGKFPIAFLFLSTPYNIVDVNIHPQKKRYVFKMNVKLIQ